MVVTAVLLGFADALVCKMLNVSVFTCAIFHGTIVVALMAEIVKNIKTLSSSLEAEKFYIKVEKTNIAQSREIQMLKNKLKAIEPQNVSYSISCKSPRKTTF